MSIDFINVSKSLVKPRVRTVLFRNMTASLPDDRITGVLARPGEGKTTLLYLANGSLNPDRGRVIRSADMSYPVGSARVFSATLTCRENVVFVSRLFGFDPKPIIRFILDFTNLGKTFDRQFRLLDRDQKTSLVFAASYAMPFETYLVDQTVVGGRDDFRIACEELVRERMKTSGFVIFTSSPRVLDRYCDTFFVIDDLSLHPADSIEAAVARLGAGGLANDEGAAEAAGDDAGD